jgi:hypothetical protein
MMQRGVDQRQTAASAPDEQGEQEQVRAPEA